MGRRKTPRHGAHGKPITRREQVHNFRFGLRDRSEQLAQTVFFEHAAYPLRRRGELLIAARFKSRELAREQIDPRLQRAPASENAQRVQR